MKPIVLFDSPLTSLSGYGEHAREVASYLCDLDNDYDVYFVDSSWGTTQSHNKFSSEKISTIFKKKISPSQVENINIYIKMGLPKDFKKIGKTNIGISALIESTEMSPNDIEYINSMDEIIVPSEFNKKTLVNTFSYDLKTNINVIPQCIVNNSDIKSESAVLLKDLDNVNESFCFLYNGTWNQSVNPQKDRKNVDFLIRSFIEAFIDSENKPALILKTHFSNFSESDYEMTLNSIKNITDDYSIKLPSIYLLHGHLTQYEIKQLYNHIKIKSLINVSHGESFGRSIFESILYNKPPIISGWSAPTEYVKDDSFWVKGELVNHGSIDELFTKSGKWYEVSKSDLISKVKDVYKNYDKYLSKTNKLSEEIKQTHNRKKISKLYKDILDKYL